MLEVVLLAAMLRNTGMNPDKSAFFTVTDSELCIADDSYLRTDTKPPKLGKG